MPWIKIFISHSTKTEEAKEFLTAVKEALAADFDVRLDETGLQGGDDWRAKLYEWMDEVHGAVLLLTAEALSSKFVQLEASVLSWRRFRQPEFVLLPVLVGEVGVEDISKGIFGEMELNRIQAVSLKDPGALAAEVARLLQVLKARDRPRTAKEVLEHQVIKLLKKENTEDDLRDATPLDWTNEGFAAGTDYYEKFARNLLRADIHSACGVIKKLFDGGMRDAMDLLALVIPSWVEEGDAKPIATLSLSDVAKRAVGLNAADPWTLHTYIGRACCKSIEHNLDVCQLVPPGYQDTLTHFRQQILEFFRPSNPFAGPSNPEEVKSLIWKREEHAQPVFVVFPAGYVPDAGILGSLREEFKTVTFFVLAGDAPAEQLKALGDKVFLLKRVDAARRKDSYEEYASLYEQLKKPEMRKR